MLAGRAAVGRCRNRPGGESDVAKLARVVELRPGMQVAEIGAGDGGMALGVARRLGPSGRLYATEIDSGSLETIRRRARAEGLDNIVTVEAEEHSTALPAECCDLIYMHRVYHHLTDAASVDRSLLASLKPGGRLAVVDMLIQPWMPARRHGIAENELIAQLTRAGFVVEKQVNGWSMLDYCVVFRKPPPGRAASTR